MNSLAVLCHTFNNYEWLWDGFLHGWRTHVGDLPYRQLLGTDTPYHKPHVLGPFEYLYSGTGEWSNRLRSLIKKIDEEYIFYIQEDMWPSAPPPDLRQLLQLTVDKDLLRLQVAPVTRLYTLQGGGYPVYFSMTSKYLVSHQPSIWRKDFLMQCLQPEESPWTNEYEGTKRLANQKQYANRIAIYPHDWFRHKCEKGKFVE